MTAANATTPRLVYSTRRAAEALDVSEDTVRRMVAKGDLELVQLSERRQGVTARSIHALLERGTQR